jgi:hypothetical protein
MEGLPLYHRRPGRDVPGVRVRVRVRVHVDVIGIVIGNVFVAAPVAVAALP